MVVSQIFSSTGIGLLVGVLLGLSASPVVGMLVGAVTAMLASIIGVDVTGKSPVDDKQAELAKKRLTLVGIRAGCFGFSCLLGIFSGIYLRTHNLLSPPQPDMSEQLDELVSIGYDEGLARELVVARAFGDKIANLKPASTSDTVLFETSSETCEKLAPDRFATSEAAVAYYQTNAPENLSKLATQIIENVQVESTRQQMLQQAVAIMCDDQR